LSGITARGFLLPRPNWNRCRQHFVFALLGVGLLSLSAALLGQEGWEKRDSWQRPTEVMDALGVRPGSVVADVGAGTGYFTFHLAGRVGPRGKVYAEDVRDQDLAKVRERAKKEGLAQIEILLGTQSDPRLPPGSLDAILVVNAYHEMKEYDAMLQGIVRALKPGGLLAIIDHETKPGEPRSTYLEHHRIPQELVREDAAHNGLHFLREEKGFEPEKSEHWFFLIFERPKPMPIQ